MHGVLLIIDRVEYIVNCGVPDPPINGALMSYSHTRVGGTVTYRCDESFRPSDSRSSVCNYLGLWIPRPYDHNCTSVIGEACTVEHPPGGI